MKIEPFIIDVHTHLGPTTGFLAYYPKDADYIHAMDVTSAEISIFSEMMLLFGEFEKGYAATLKVLEQYPNRLRAYTVFNPNWPDISLKLMSEYEDHPGFVGCKIHPARHAIAAEDARYREFWDYAEEKKLVVLTHSWSPDPNNPNQDLSTPDRFAEILETRPNLQLILGHTGGREVGHRMAVDLMNKYPNCWSDISGDTMTFGLMEWLVEKAGADRFLFGTDANWIDPRFHVGRILKCKLSVEDRLKILRNNALTLFGESLVGNFK